MIPPGQGSQSTLCFCWARGEYQLPTKLCRHQSGKRIRNFACFSQVRVGRISPCLALLAPLGGEINYHCSKSLCWGEGSEVVEDMGIKDQPPSWSNWKCGSVCVCVCVCVCVWCEGEWIFLWCAWLEQGRYCQTFLFCYATLFLVFWLGGIGFSWEFCVCSGGSVPVSSSGLEASARPFLRYTEGSEKCR